MPAEQFDEAEVEFKEALRLKPGQATVHFNLGLTCVGAGRSADAAAQFKEYLRLNPTADDAALVQSWIADLEETN